MTRWLTAALAASLVFLCSPVHADEGMWTFHGFPLAKANAVLKSNIDQAWLDRVRASIVRINGCTGSFVSGEGLILTNHHCVEPCLGEMSTKDKSYDTDGFLARTRGEEVRCQTQIADVLVAMEETTATVAAATAGKGEAAANDARKAELTRLEQECESSSKLKCQAVTLYTGGQYWLYKYKRYTDVRLVFAPEIGIASFGGDPDNFQFPRWNLDMGVLRAYENGAPAATPNYLKMNFAGPAAGEAVFIAGHPGTTNRQLTVSMLEQQRNQDVPQWLLRYSEIRGRYIQFAAESPEHERITIDQLNSIENAIKVRRKGLDALHDDDMLARKSAEEDALRKAIAKNAKLKASVGDPWKDIDTALATERRLYEEYLWLESGAGFQGRLATYGRTLVRGAAERDKPNGQRLREYTDARLPIIEQQLGAKVAVFPELEAMRLSQGLERMREWLGPDHPVVRRLLSKESPAALAKRVANESKLADPAFRMELWKGGAAAIAASQDPIIALMRDVEPEARAVRKAQEDGVEAPLRAATERLAKARFAVLGTSVYPDATFTLRLNWGTVQGWNENGTDIQPFTKLGRAFDRATGADPFRIPDSWTQVKDKLDMNTPFNFSTNNDVVGGNSGSPAINAKGELVGLFFDGNIHSISGNFWFDTARNRAIAVHPAIIREALTKVYGADALLNELTK
jgi:Peptidase S46